MARVKMFAHQLLIGLGVLAFFAASSGVAYQAAGAAVSFGGYLSGR